MSVSICKKLLMVFYGCKMVKNNKRKTNGGDWSEESVKNVVESLIKGKKRLLSSSETCWCTPNHFGKNSKGSS